jgi:hypothetical protein
VAFFIKTGTIFRLKKWGNLPLYNEETSKEITMLYIELGFIALLVLAAIEPYIDYVDNYKKNKGDYYV